MTAPRRPSPGRRLYRVLLRLLPSEFRGDFGSEMSEVFEEERREASAAGPATVIGLWARTVRGVVTLAPREHAAILIRDAAYGLRMMRQFPGTTTAAVVTMALGIGVNTAMFSVVNAVLLGLPFKNPDRIYRLATDSKPGRQPPALTAGTLKAWADAPGFEAVAGFANELRTVSGAEVERVSVECVSASMFRVLGVSPSIGRAFEPSDDRAGSAAVIVLSHQFWATRLGADPAIVGRVITMDDAPVTVLGVMPPAFAGPLARDGVAGWAPLEPRLAKLRAGGRVSDPFINIFAKLRAGASIADAVGPLNSVLRGLAPDDPTARIEAIPIAEQITGDVRPMLVALWGATACVLLISCANVAGLLVGRGNARRHEMAVRLALGSARGRIVRQLLTESLLLCVIGGAAGIALAAWGLGTIVAILPAYMPGASRISLDARVFAMSAMVTLGTGVMFGLLPALQASRVPATGALGSDRGSTGAPSRRRARQVLVVAEIALSLAVLVGAGLLVRTFLHLRPDAPGFDASGKIVAGFSLPRASYPTEASKAAFYDELSRRIGETPGVAGVSAASVLPLSGLGDLARFKREDAAAAATPRRVFAAAVTANYFAEMSIPVLQGRGFSDVDRAGGQQTVIVNQSLFLSLGGPAVLGTRLVVTDDTGSAVTRTIVGVVGDTRMFGNSAQSRTQLFLPLPQTTGFSPQMVVRVNQPVAGMIPVIRNVIRSLDPRLPGSSLTAMADDVQRQVSVWRFAAFLMGSFAALAILLAGVGLFAVVAGSVTDRTREIGVRIALGARSSDVLRTIQGRALTMTIAGLVIGLGLAFATTRLLGEWLVDVSPLDTRTFVFASLAMTVVAAIASYLPARRALKVDPIIALRSE